MLTKWSGVCSELKVLAQKPWKTISEVSCEFPHISRAVLYEIISTGPGYQKFCARCFPKMLTKRREWLRLWLLRAIPRRWQCIPQSRCTSNSWWNPGFICECWEQIVVKQWMHTQSPNKPKKLKQTLSACQKADGSCFLGEERVLIWNPYNRGYNNVRNVLRNTK
jgi:hypothetical protein